MFHLARILPKYKSVTQWDKHGLQPPCDSKSFSAIKPAIQTLCPCIYNTGFLFHWKTKRLLLDADLHCTNDLVCEEAMWLLVDVVHLTEQLEESRHKGTGIKGQILQKLYATLERINSLSWPDRNDNEASLLLNLNKDWNKISCGIKLPWLLLPSCNHSLRIWIKAELLNCQFMDQPEKTIEGFTKTAITCANLVDNALACSTNCPEDYRIILGQELKRRQLTALYWVSDREEFQNNYAERFRILEKAFELVAELQQVSGGIDEKLANKVNEKYEREKNQLVFVTGGRDYNKDISDPILRHLKASGDTADIESLMAYTFPL